MEGQNVAIYLDFENLAISADAVYPSQARPLRLQPIVDFAASKGTVFLKKAYADWSKNIFAQYQNKLLEQGFELVHLPATNKQGKNGSDVHLAVDVMEYMALSPSLDTYIIGSGDTDFIPLIQRLRTRGKRVIVIGFEHSVGPLVKRNSTEFRTLESLLGQPEIGSPSGDLHESPDPSYGRQLMLRFIQSSEETDPVLMSQLKQNLLRLDPSFSEKDLGFSNFKSFVRSMVGDLVEKIDTEHTTLPVVHLKEPSAMTSTKEPISETDRDNAMQFLSRKLRYQKEAPLRQDMSQALFASFSQQAVMSMNEMFEKIHEALGNELAKTDIRKYINTLFTGGAFAPHNEEAEGPLLSRPFELVEDVAGAEDLDEIYIRRVSEILQSRYADLPSREILELLI
ncbi:MAG: NYN domain-containing protein [Bacteroidota bacterium]